MKWLMKECEGSFVKPAGYILGRWGYYYATAGTGIPMHAWYNPSWENIGHIRVNYLSPNAITY